MKYFGWVPNLRGRLSFSAIGSSTLPYRSSSFATKDAMLISQDRTLHDSALPRFVRRPCFEIPSSPIRKLLIGLHKRKIITNKKFERLLFNSGDFEFVYCQKNVTDEDISGCIYVVSKDRQPERFKKYKTHLNELKISKQEFSAFESLLSEYSVVSANFRLQRSGIVEFSGLKLQKIERSELKWTNKKQYQQFQLEAVSQLYYYLKDLCHQHQHHDSKSDTFLPLVSCSKSDTDINVALEKLADETFKSLYRVILKMRRTHTVNDYYSMKGILSYIGSFRRIIKNEPYGKAIVEKYSAEGDKGISESIEAKSSNLMFLDDQKNRFWSSAPSIGSLTIATMALLLAFSSLVTLINRSAHLNSTDISSANSVEFSESYTKFVTFVLTQPFSVLAGLGFIYFTLFLSTSSVFKYCKLRQDLMRLIYAFGKRRLVASAFVLISVIMIFIGLNSLSYFSLEPILSFYHEIKDSLGQLMNHKLKP